MGQNKACYVAVHSTIKQIIKIFYRLGIWEEKKSSRIRSLAKKFFYFIFYSSFFTSITTGVFVTEDKNEAIFLAAVSMASAVCSLKLKCVLCQQEDIYTFIEKVGNHSLTDQKECVRINKRLDNLMKFATIVVFSTFIGVTPLFILYLPIFSHERKLPLNIWFPFDWKNSEIAYWTAYFYIFFAFIFTILYMFLNAIIWYLMMNFAIKYECLGNESRNLNTKKMGERNRNISEPGVQIPFLQEVLDLIQRHQQLKVTIDSFSSALNNLFFIQITNSCIIICGSLYVMTFTDNFVLTVTYFSTGMYNIFDIFMVMYFGNEIKLSSNRLSYCLFESNWTGQSKSYQKIIVILGEVLRQPHQLIISKLYTLNLETFTLISNVTYRMFNMLIRLR